jgi:hypothetical protein
MLNKFLKVMLIGVVLTVNSVTHAGIINHIDNGSYTTIDGLDWLDWSATLNMTQSVALSSQPGWRIADFSELDQMLRKMFGPEQFVPTYTPTLFYGFEIVDFVSKRDRFTNLFGIFPIFPRQSTSIVEGLGKFGVDQSFLYIGSVPSFYGAVGYKQQWLGVPLVRAAQVPEPSTLAILGLGLIGLSFRRFKKKA